MGLIPTLNAPVAGNPRVPTPLVANDNAIRTVVNGNIDAANLASNAVTTAKITDANVTDAKLASPANATYRTVMEGGVVAGGATVNTWYITTAGTASVSGSATTNFPPMTFRYLSGDFSPGALTTRFRVTMDVLVGATSPSTTVLTAGLYPVTISGGNYTLGTVVTGSTVASSSLATNTISPFDTSDFAASALTTNTLYALAFAVTSITVPAGIGANLTLTTHAT
jgi:hypothetical protein